MAWPPDPIAADLTNATVAQDTHPDHHNELAGAINDLVDYVDGLEVGGGGGDIPQVAGKGVPVGIQVGQATTGIGSGRSYGSLWRVLDPVTITAAHVFVTTAQSDVGALVRVAIYEKDDFGSAFACTLVSDLGTVAVDSTGEKTISLGTPLDLDAGVYITRIIHDGGNTANLGGVRTTGVGLGITTGAVVTNNWRPHTFTQDTANASSEVSGGASATWGGGIGAGADGNGGLYQLALFTFARQT